MVPINADLSDDDFDELASEYGSDEDFKPHGESNVAAILKGMLQEPRFKTISLRSLYGKSRQPTCNGGQSRGRECAS